MDELVQMLSDDEHNAEVLHSKDASEVKEQVDRKWINMKFTDIGTSITFQLDEAPSDYAAAITTTMKTESCLSANTRLTMNLHG